ncbi:hypothetical protein CVV43_01740 [Candidatus Saccharibacteria bacterium HGW-Saccharibacteria-1]|jgi:F-type H+-transporting ATPase subunit delta|nr:MAG: hypothetical protein CVV43_01740 [Candidatus Saccharibacteria bacterium HGW-Saccharibacteria-1]
MAVRLSRRKITNYIADQLVDGCDEKELVKQLASFLVDNKRVGELELVIRDVEYELKNRGIVLARITSAFDLAASMKDAIIKLVKDETGAEHVQLSQFVDPSVLGGIKLDLPGQQFDGTIARKLLTLRTSNKE